MGRDIPNLTAGIHSFPQSAFINLQSQHIAINIPPPNVCPLMAAIVGMLNSNNRFIIFDNKLEMNLPSLFDKSLFI